MESLSPEIKAGTKSAEKAVLKRGVTKSPITGEIGLAQEPGLRETAQVIKDTVPNFEKLKTATDKFNAVDDGIGKVANELRTNLKGEVQPLLTPEDLTQLETSFKADIAKNPVLVGDAGKQAELIFNHFKELLPTGRDITMEDVLNARQSLDKWIEKLKGGSAFDPKMENAFSTGLRAVRQGANNLMEVKVPDANVKGLLRKQTLLYDALDRLAPSVSKELGTTKLSRFIGRHPLVTGAIKKAATTSLLGAGAGLGMGLLKND